MEVYCKMTLIEILSERQHSWKSGKYYADVLRKVDKGEYGEKGEYDPNTPSGYGRNALHLAVIFGCEIELFKAILSKITNVNAVDNDNNTALMYACNEHKNCGDGDGMYCRKKTTNKNFYGEQETLSLKDSLQHTLVIFKSLMQHKDIDVNIQSTGSSSRQQTALMFAFKTYGYESQNPYGKEKRETGRQILLELVKKSDCELFGGYQSGLTKKVLGFNALHFAVFYGCDTKVFDMILGKIKNVNQPTKDTKPEYIKDGKYIKDSNETALHLISMKRYSGDKTENVQYMLKKLLNHPKINVNAADEGRTALYYAIQAENLATVKLLIEKGIDYTISANEGKYKGMSAMEMAFKVARTTGNKRNYDIAYYLSGYIEKQGCCANGSLQACRKFKF